MRKAILTVYVAVMSALSEVLFVMTTITCLILPKTCYARWLLLGAIAQTRFKLGMLAVSKRLSFELLKQADNHVDDWNYGNAIHLANTLLGRIALREGDVTAAKRYLIASGQTRGSPQLNTFGPNMRLANELLRAGERGVVLEYFKHCSKFWASEFSRLNQWEKDICEGRRPRFGPNLYY